MFSTCFDPSQLVNLIFQKHRNWFRCTENSGRLGLMSSKSPRIFRPFRSSYHPSDRKFHCWCRMQRKRVEASVMAVGKVCSLNKMFKWKCIQPSHIHQLTGSKLCFKRQGRHLPNGKPPVPLFISLGAGPLSAAPQQI